MSISGIPLPFPPSLRLEILKDPQSGRGGAPQAEVHGRTTGTGLPGVILAGTVRNSDSVTFAVCHGHGPAVILDLAGQPYDRIVVTVENPEEIISRLR